MGVPDGMPIAMPQNPTVIRIPRHVTAAADDDETDDDENDENEVAFFAGPEDEDEEDTEGEDIINTEELNFFDPKSEREEEEENEEKNDSDRGFINDEDATLPVVPGVATTAAGRSSEVESNRQIISAANSRLNQYRQFGATILRSMLTDQCQNMSQPEKSLFVDVINELMAQCHNVFGGGLDEISIDTKVLLLEVYSNARAHLDSWLDNRTIEEHIVVRTQEIQQEANEAIPQDVQNRARQIQQRFILRLRNFYREITRRFVCATFRGIREHRSGHSNIDDEINHENFINMLVAFIPLAYILGQFFCDSNVELTRKALFKNIVEAYVKYFNDIEKVKKSLIQNGTPTTQMAHEDDQYIRTRSRPDDSTIDGTYEMRDYNGMHLTAQQPVHGSIRGVLQWRRGALLLKQMNIFDPEWDQDENDGPLRLIDSFDSFRNNPVSPDHFGFITNFEICSSDSPLNHINESGTEFFDGLLSIVNTRVACKNLIKILRIRPTGLERQNQNLNDSGVLKKFQHPYRVNNRSRVLAREYNFIPMSPLAYGRLFLKDNTPYNPLAHYNIPYIVPASNNIFDNNDSTLASGYIAIKSHEQTVVTDPNTGQVNYVNVAPGLLDKLAQFIIGGHCELNEQVVPQQIKLENTRIDDDKDYNPRSRPRFEKGRTRRANKHQQRIMELLG